MKIAYDHLLRFLDDKPEIEDLSRKLFQLGHEHEIEDSIFNMEFTPNRGDCLSLKGLARDLNVFYKTNLEVPVYSNELPSLDLNFINKAQDKCPQISFLNIEIEGEISEYKGYLNNYFEDLKINKNNFFADVSNYIAYEMGQPTHCYEFSSIGEDITLLEDNTNSPFTTLFGDEIHLNGSNLVFTSEGKIINLSGVMGGIETSCNNKTKNVLIESAYFKPDSIIGKAVKYNLQSDSSHKFERSTDPKCHETALRRFIQIVDEHSKIKKLGIFKGNVCEFKELNLELNLKKVNNILGLNISEDDFKKSLIKLGFSVDKTIKVPSYRSDIQHQNDLAEEIARVIGYDNIPVSSINLEPKTNELNLNNETKIKNFLIEHGFMEVINSPFCINNSSDSIKVDNPLDSNRESIRVNIIDSLIENLIYNEKRQKDSIKIFEISDLYKSNQGIQRERKLALLISGRRGHDYKDFSRKLDEAYLKEIFQKIDINIDENIFSIDRNKLNSKVKTPIFAIELKIDELLLNINNHIFQEASFANFIKYKPISEFPSSFRDFSFSIKDFSKISDLINTLSSVESKIIKNFYIFDFYENKKTNEFKIGYRFIFQSNSRTLTDIEIDKEMKEILNSILLIESVSLPGSI